MEGHSSQGGQTVSGAVKKQGKGQGQTQTTAQEMPAVPTCTALKTTGMHHHHPCIVRCTIGCNGACCGERMDDVQPIWHRHGRWGVVQDVEWGLVMRAA